MAKVCFMCNTAAWIFSAQPFLARGALLLRRLYAQLDRPTRVAMGKHFSEGELDAMQQWKAKGVAPTDICRRLQQARRRGGQSWPNLASVRRVIRPPTNPLEANRCDLV